MTNKDLGELARREFLIGLSALGLGACAGLPSGPSSFGAARIINPHYEQATIDLSDVLGRPATHVTNRWAPRLPPHNPNWEGHYYRVGYIQVGGRPGIDYAPVSAGYTEIVPVAAGLVTLDFYTTNGGWSVQISHGGSIFTEYAHLAEKPYAKEGDLVNRNTVIALMGNTGEWARTEHLHLDTYGYKDIVTHLKLHHLHERGFWLASAPLSIDAEEFSILGRHKELPYQIPDDSRLDEQHRSNLIRARNYGNGIIKDFFPALWDFKKGKSFDNVYADLELGNDIGFLYGEVLKILSGVQSQLISADKLQHFRAKAPEFKKELEQIIVSHLIPRFTAPIVELGKGKNYDHSLKSRKSSG